MFVDTREVVMHFVPLYAKGRTLDVGGGTSKYREIIKKFVSEYIVSDLYAAPDVDYIEDARAMSFPDESFDTALSFQLLEHVDDTAAVVSELHRVLKRGGHAIVTMPFLFPQHGDPSDYHRFTVDGARFFFERAGFEVIEAGSQGSTWSVLAQILRCIFLNPYVKNHGRIREAVFRRLYIFLSMLDKRGVFKRPDLYTNVYIIARKVI